MNVCDVCNANLESPNGYLLTTRQVVSNPAYWEKAFSRGEREFVHGDGRGRGRDRGRADDAPTV